MMHRENIHQQQGNALFLILIAVALFAALSYAITQSGRGSGSAAKEQAVLESAKLIQYATNIQQAVSRMRLVNGCTDTSITFENTIVSGYTNASAPVNKSCHVFDPAGGGQTWQLPAAGSGTTSNWFFTGESCVYAVGTGVAGCHGTNGATDSDLVAAVSGISKDVCVQINRGLGINNPSGNPPQANNQTWDNPVALFTGTYTQGDHSVQSDKSGQVDLFGKAVGCFNGDVFPATGTYTAYMVLIER